MNQLEARAAQSPKNVHSVEWEHMVSPGSRFLLPVNMASQPHYRHLPKLKQSPRPQLQRGALQSQAPRGQLWGHKQARETETESGNPRAPEGHLHPDCALCKLCSLLTFPSAGLRTLASSPAGPPALHRVGWPLEGGSLQAGGSMSVLVRLSQVFL